MTRDCIAAPTKGKRVMRRCADAWASNAAVPLHESSQPKAVACACHTCHNDGVRVQEAVRKYFRKQIHTWSDDK